MLAVDGVNVEAGPGEVVAFDRPNGAGKTSLMDAVSGFTRYQGPCSSTVSRLMAGQAIADRLRDWSGPSRDSSCSPR